jgi:peptidoglycan/LPS O-acetylase OafA/YrhL
VAEIALDGLATTRPEQKLGASLPKYRPALDGLRAIAVLSVLFYHLGYRWMRGGFLGVDIFFVLSGYLITSILAAELYGRGIGLGSFWARRARRLLPAVLVVCTVVAVGVHSLEPTSDWQLRQSDLIWTIFYGVNWHLIASDQDYFAQYLSASPLRHAWSLAIEEQFYVVWPLALIILAWFVRRSRLILAMVVGAAAVISAVVMALLYDPGAPSRAYFGTDARAHELLVGALLGLGLAGRPSLLKDRGKAASFVAVAGLVAIGVALVLVPDSWSWYYRGGSLLLAVIVIAVLWAVESRPISIVGRALSLAPMRWLGQISYGIYLWHWPVIFFTGIGLAALIASPVKPLITSSNGLNLVRIFLTVAIATVSFYALEQPIRRGRLFGFKLTNRWVLGLAPVAMIATAAASIALTAVPPVIAKANAPGEYLCPDNSLMCVRHTASTTSRPVLAVVGDSTARSLDAGITDLSQKYDWTYVAAAQNGCSIIDRVALLIADVPLPGNARCPNDNASIRRQLLDTYHPDLIIAMERFLLADYVDSSGKRVVAGTPEHLRATEQGLEQSAIALVAGGARLVFIRTLPVAMPLDCTNQSPPSRTDCHVQGSSDQITVEYDAIIDRVAARHPGTMSVISMASYVCPNDYCFPKVDGLLLRYDRYHFTMSAAHRLAPVLYGQLEQAGLVPIARRTVVPSSPNQ